MYTVNIYYSYYILHHLCIIPVIPHPFFPISATFHQFIPASFLPFPALFLAVSALLFPLPGPFFQFLPISPSSCTLSLYTGPFPLFQIWPAPFLPPLAAPVSQFLVLFSQFIFPIFQLFFLSPVLSVPSVPLLFTFQFLLLFVQLMSFLLCRPCLLFTVPISFAHFPFPLLHFLSSYHPSLFPNSLALPSSSSWCSVSSLFVVDDTSVFVYWDEIMRVVKPLGHCWSKLLKL